MKRSAFLVLALGVIASEQVARADPTKEQCVDAYRMSQQLRREGAYRSAVEQLVICARNPCPAVLQPDCIDWLREVRALVPSIVVKARAGNIGVADVRVSMDGTQLTDRLDGRAMDVDVGVHTFVFERPGAPRVEQRLLMAEGEKGRLVEIVFPSPSVEVPSPEHRSPSSGRATWPAYLLGAVGVAALGTFATFGAMGLSDRGDLSSCKPGCSRARIDGVESKFFVADVSLVVGLVALAGAGVVHLLEQSSR